MLPRTIADHLARVADCRVVHAEPTHGGSIHAAWQVHTARGSRLFVKTSPQAPPDSFSREAEGLRWLGQFGAVDVPEVAAVHDGDGEAPGYLALSWIDTVGQRDEALLAENLAALHDCALRRPGWRVDNYIGPLKQANDVPGGMRMDSGLFRTDGGNGAGEFLPWPTFWVQKRLGPMLLQAHEVLAPATVERVHAACERAGDLCRDAPTAPLHGDLWAGNVVWGPAGRPFLVDPAVFAGDPEVDLAMMALFGGFGAAFWLRYQALRPRRAGYEARRALYQLWYLLVHAVLFGEAYASRVDQAAQTVLTRS
jgi:fructosamine-3-kinase